MFGFESSGVLLAMDRKSPQYAGGQRNPRVESDGVPNLQSFSDVAWLKWKAADSVPSTMRYFATISISNTDTRGVFGKVLDQAMQAAGLDRGAAWMTNAVKHFKFTPRAGRRIHQSPDKGEVLACKWWLNLERGFVRPRLTMALGGTAALALTGQGAGITKRRGTVEATPEGPVLLSWHPSYILRIPDAARAAEARAELAEDLDFARRLLAGG